MGVVDPASPRPDLPLALVMTGKAAFRLPNGLLTLFVMLAIGEQFLIFTFTPLATEAIKQTGLSRGLLHVAPVVVLLTIFLLDRLLQRDSD